MQMFFSVLFGLIRHKGTVGLRVQRFCRAVFYLTSYGLGAFFLFGYFVKVPTLNELLYTRGTAETVMVILWVSAVTGSVNAGIISLRNRFIQSKKLVRRLKGDRVGAGDLWETFHDATHGTTLCIVLWTAFFAPPGEAGVYIMLSMMFVFATILYALIPTAFVVNKLDAATSSLMGGESLDHKIRRFMKNA